MVGIYTLSLLDMPDEILLRILMHLPNQDLFWVAGFTCKRMLAIACELNSVIEVDEENRLLGDNEVKSKEAERIDELFEWREVAASLTHIIVPNETSWKLCNQICRHIRFQNWDELGIVIIFKIKSLHTVNTLLARIGDYCTSLQGLYITNYNGKFQMDNVIEKVSKNCSTLKELNLQGCYEITDEGINAVAQNCKELSSLNVTWMYQFLPRNVTHESINSIARKCHNLTELHLNQHMYAFMQRDDESNINNFTHFQINDVVKNVAEECSGLKKLHLIYTHGINDIGIKGMARNCKQLEDLNLTGCVQVTDSGFKNIADNCRYLTILVASWCNNLSDIGLIYLTEKCRYLKVLNIEGCRMITDYGINRMADSCVELSSLDISHCLNIGQEAVERVVERCSKLKELRVKQCTQIFVQDIIDHVKHRCRVWW